MSIVLLLLQGAVTSSPHHPSFLRITPARASASITERNASTAITPYNASLEVTGA